MNHSGYTKVRELMTAQPVVIDGLATVGEAIDVMRKEHLSSLVIERRHEGDEYGMVTVHDIAAKVLGPDRSPDRTSVYEIMAKPVLSLDAEMDIRYAIRLLSRFHLTRALVTEHGEMIGIVTLRDMALRRAAP